MGIQRFYNQEFTVKVRTETVTKGKVSRGYSSGIVYKGAVFTPGIIRTVRFDKQDFVIGRNLYCAVSTAINMGDIVSIDSIEYDVVHKQDTNNNNHHLKIGLSSR